MMTSRADRIAIAMTALLLVGCSGVPYPPVGEPQTPALAPLPKAAVERSAPTPQAEANAGIERQPLAPAPGQEASTTATRPQGELRMFVFTDEPADTVRSDRAGYEIRFQLFPEYAQSRE